MTISDSGTVSAVAGVFRLSRDLEERGILDGNIREIRFRYFPIIQLYQGDIERVFQARDIEEDISRGLPGKYPRILENIPFLIRNTRTEICLPGKVPHKKLRLGIREELDIANLVEKEENPSKYQNGDKCEYSGVFIHTI